ncbi:MAG: tetratricopeptide repeat protein [Terracidiphilus sp.]
MNQAPTSAARRSLPATQAYGIAAVCLALGLIAGFFARGARTPATATASRAAIPSVSGVSHAHVLSIEELKQIADKQAAPLLQKLTTDPNNAALLVQVGTIYHATHQFPAAAAYFGRAAQADPANVAIRSKLAASLFRGGDADGAIVQLNQALHYSPTDANSLFNLGLIRWQGKQDAKGALAAWQLLLKSNPQLSSDRKATVRRLIAEVQASRTAPPAAQRSANP